MTWCDGGDSSIPSGNKLGPDQVHHHTQAGIPGIFVGAAAKRFVASSSILDMLQPGIRFPDQTSQQTSCDSGAKLHEFALLEGMGMLTGVCRFGFATGLGHLVQREELQGITTYSTERQEVQKHFQQATPGR